MSKETHRLDDPGFRAGLGRLFLLTESPWFGDDTGVYDDTDRKVAILPIWDYSRSDPEHPDRGDEEVAALGPLLAEARNVVAYLRPEVLVFARLMEAKLREHDGDHIDDRAGADRARLAAALTTHSWKLHDRVEFAARERIASDIADCLNYLLMIADVTGVLASLGGEGEGT